MTYQNIGQWIAAANDLVGTVGGQATPGWVSGQRWSTTAGQWQTAAWDPNNTGTYAWSLGNQLWRTTAQTWKTRADTAYDSGVWGTGSTWQADYNAEVTLYNNEVAAYNAGIPRALAKWQGNSVATTIVFGAWTVVNFGAPSVDALSMGSGASITFQRTGQYVVSFAVNTPGNSGESFQMRLLVGGSVVVTENFADTNSSDVARIYWSGAATAGQTLQAQAWHYQATRTLGAKASEVTFVPTPANPQ